MASIDSIQKIDDRETRMGFGDGLAELGETNPNVVALTADLAGSLRMDKFIAKYPERFVQCGIAEANMIGVAAGIAAMFGAPSIVSAITGKGAYDCTNN